MATDPRDGVLLRRLFVSFATLMVAVFLIVQFFARSWPGREYTGDKLALVAGVIGAILCGVSAWLVHRAFALYRAGRSRN